MAEVRERVARGEVNADTELALAGHDFWTPAASWAALELDAEPPGREPVASEPPGELTQLEHTVAEGLRWWLRRGERIAGPMSTAALRQDVDEQGEALVRLVGGDRWFPAATLLERTSRRAQAASLVPAMDCPICLESIPSDSRRCPECREQLDPPSTTRPTSIPDQRERGAGFLRLHWRPALTMLAIAGLLATGITLRHLAPQRYHPPERMAPAAPASEPECESRCWNGEACQLGSCVWQPSNDVGSLDDGFSIAGPFELPDETADVLPLDDERFAVSYIRGVQITDTRTGAVEGLVSDAPRAQRLFRVGEVVYAAAPRRLYVIDAASTRVLKTVELGNAVSDIAIGASGRRVLAAMPGAKTVAVMSTDYHAEVSRFFFGDDHVRTVAISDTGDRALTANGEIPLAGLNPSREARLKGGMYALDPSLLPSEQDRIRTGLVGNPVDVVMAPDDRSSFVALREKDTIVRLERLDNGSVRQQAHWKTCRQPEELALIRRGRRLAVRCNVGKAIEIFDLDEGELEKRIPVGSRIADMTVSPDNEKLLLTLPRDGKGEGALGVVDLGDYGLDLHRLPGEPQRLRTTPDGRTTIVVSNRSKKAWVIR